MYDATCCVQELHAKPYSGHGISRQGNRTGQAGTRNGRCVRGRRMQEQVIPASLSAARESAPGGTA
jgi:hypothetical protein